MTLVIDFFFTIWKKIVSTGVQFWVVGVFILLGLIDMVITLVLSSQRDK